MFYKTKQMEIKLKNMEIKERKYITGRVINGYAKLKTNCQFHSYIKIGGSGCCKCYYNQGTTKSFVKCSFPE